MLISKCIGLFASCLSIMEASNKVAKSKNGLRGNESIYIRINNGFTAAATVTNTTFDYSSTGKFFDQEGGSQKLPKRHCSFVVGISSLASKNP